MIAVEVRCQKIGDNGNLYSKRDRNGEKSVLNSEGADILKTNRVLLDDSMNTIFRRAFFLLLFDRPRIIR